MRIESSGGRPRCVYTAAPSDTEQPSASTLVVAETNEPRHPTPPVSQEPARKRVESAPFHLVLTAYCSDFTSSSEIPLNQQAATVTVLSSAASASVAAPPAPLAAWPRFPLPDEGVSHFTVHPEEDEAKYASLVV